MSKFKAGQVGWLKELWCGPWTLVVDEVHLRLWT